MSAAAQQLTSPISLLVASANASFKASVLRRLGESAWKIDLASGGADALGKLERFPSRVLLLDRKLPDLDPAEVLEMVEARYPGVDVILMNSQTGEVQFPSETRSSTTDLLLQGLGEVVLQPKVKQESPLAAHDEVLPGMVGSSEVMKRLSRLVRLVANTDTAVLITGETGTGKELLAEALHKLSARRCAKPFITVNCAAIPETLLEAELFGHTRGAFTGAVQSRIGKIHAAQGGTLFLDEIGEMLPAMQAKLLRFLENSEVQRLGSSDCFRVDVRVIAATNCRLQQKVQRGEFREDLYYRLAVFPIEAPPLRDRGGDLGQIACHFARKFAGQSAVVSEDAMALLQAHCWPGNVRELKHVLERAAILAEGATEVHAEHLCLTTFGPGSFESLRIS
jgi:DNA-binding NtrC family response regulator